MFSHTYTGVADFARAEAFYAPILARLGLRLKFSDAAHGMAGWMPADAARPLFLVGLPFEGEAAPGNGQMLALMAPSRAAVDATHALALALGGRCDGPPGLRPHYHPDYYGAYLRDPDGNKLCICCHDKEA